ncbi:hypothetical protein JHK82_051796 [Glycine max]|uniref:Uncharacterized protein n=1 Tax=Glycine max TaxID=3847 RepID=A0A0R0F4V0_SOYBN|nr:hypothetical protein JHK86_051628 [Glycine max]KAG5093018.1 hypothetical protein JHK82_051796 [Glycine max]KAG5096082.1 hypothetical protein JHK84_051670 [Glycine max]KRH01452.1 hypothetical protein GLYMA_18G277900v4 [Glycine max]
MQILDFVIHDPKVFIGSVCLCITEPLSLCNLCYSFQFLFWITSGTCCIYYL